MGAYEFSVKAKGKTPQEAFQTARDEAAWEHGHGGYTGTIAEKHEFVMIDIPKGDGGLPIMSADAYAESLVANGDERVYDKWGPAGCIALGGGEFLFFGRASS